MEGRPAKRLRLLPSWAPDAATLSEHPDLARDRQLNDLRLKSRFEQIFEKYEKDFTGVADVINFENGEVEEDNGHISRMHNERDTGENNPARFLTSFIAGDHVSDSEEVVDTEDPETGIDDTLRQDELADSVQGDATNTPEELTYFNQPNESIVAPNTFSVPNQPETAAVEALGQSIAMQIMNFMSTFKTPNIPNIPNIPIDPRWATPPLSVTESAPVRQPRQRRLSSPTTTTSIWALPEDGYPRRRRRRPRQLPREIQDDQVTRGTDTTTDLDNEVDSDVPGIIQDREDAIIEHETSPTSDEVADMNIIASIRVKQPNFKWTDVDDKLLSNLKRHTGLSWEVIRDYWPDRPIHALKGRWYNHLREKVIQEDKEFTRKDYETLLKLKDQYNLGRKNNSSENSEQVYLSLTHQQQRTKNGVSSQHRDRLEVSEQREIDSDQPDTADTSKPHRVATDRSLIDQVRGKAKTASTSHISPARSICQRREQPTITLSNNLTPQSESSQSRVQGWSEKRTSKSSPIVLVEPTANAPSISKDTKHPLKLSIKLTQTPDKPLSSIETLSQSAKSTTHSSDRKSGHATPKVSKDNPLGNGSDDELDSPAQPLARSSYKVGRQRPVPKINKNDVVANPVNIPQPRPQTPSSVRSKQSVLLSQIKLDKSLDKTPSTLKTPARKDSSMKRRFIVSNDDSEDDLAL